MNKHIPNTLLLSLLLFLFSCADSNDVVPRGNGQGGSMARFTVSGDYLYVVDSRNLHVYEVKDPSNPVKVNDITLGFDIETIFPYQGKLFIGAMGGMHIYDIATPENPVHLSTYQHIRSCDPVVVQGNLAYVTLRTGGNCPGGANQLEIIDISNPSNPQLVSSFEMENPFGLGIDGNTLFICEGEAGLRVLDVADPQDIKVLSEVADIHAFDVIPRSNNLILTGKDGVFQFDYTDPEKLIRKSRLSILDCE